MPLDPNNEPTLRPDPRPPANRRRSVPLLRRLALTASIVFCGSLAFAAAASAYGGGLTPGGYVFTNTSAYATVGILKGGPPDVQGFSVYVNRGLNSYQPEDEKGQPTVSNGTMVQVSMFSSTGGTFGCFLINPSDFKVSKNLQSATLHTTLTSPNCPGDGSPVTGKSAIAPITAKGGGLPLPMTLDLTWSGLGVTATSRDRSSFQCLDYSYQSNNVSHTSAANASGTVSAVTGAFKSDVGGVSSTDTHLDISGTPKPACLV
jgi:hypothetical protein